MTSEREQARPITATLRFKLALLLAAVLLPLTLISAVKSMSVAKEIRARSEAALTGEIRAAAAPVLESIQTARGAAEILALTAVSVLGDRVACSALMREVHTSEPIYALAGFIPLDGNMRCSSHDAPLDFSQYWFFSEVIEKNAPALSVNRVAPVGGASVLGVSHPVNDASGAYRGIVYLSLPHRSLERRDGGKGPLELMTFDRDGAVLTASGGFSDAIGYLPGGRDLKEFMTLQARTFSAQSVSQGERLYAFLPLVPGELYALGTWPADGVSSFDSAGFPMPILLPALTWVASLFVAWLGVERLVTRHIRKLSQSIKSFAGGDRMVGDISVAGAPLEIREMADAYEQMTDTILRDEAQMEDTVHQKEVLLREVHHRVKNNLQLIASIMNMQTRKARTPETRDMLKELQSRVMSLATVHRELYQTPGVADIHADELIYSIAKQTVAMASVAGRRFDLRADIADILMTPDQAVPLALLIAEALMNAVKFASVEENAVIDVTLERDGPEDVVLCVSNATTTEAVGKPKNAAETTGLGTQLMEGFAMQMGGKLQQNISDGRYRLTVAFNLRPLAEAEARNASNMTFVL